MDWPLSNMRLSLEQPPSEGPSQALTKRKSATLSAGDEGEPQGEDLEPHDNDTRMSGDENEPSEEEREQDDQADAEGDADADGDEEDSDEEEEQRPKKKSKRKTTKTGKPHIHFSMRNDIYLLRQGDVRRSNRLQDKGKKPISASASTSSEYIPASIYYFILKFGYSQVQGKAWQKGRTTPRSLPPHQQGRLLTTCRRWRLQGTSVLVLK